MVGPGIGGRAARQPRACSESAERRLAAMQRSHSAMCPVHTGRRRGWEDPNVVGKLDDRDGQWRTAPMGERRRPYNTPPLAQMSTAKYAMCSTPSPRSSRKRGPSPDDCTAAEQAQRDWIKCSRHSTPCAALRLHGVHESTVQLRRVQRSATGTACGDRRGLEAGTWLIMRPM